MRQHVLCVVAVCNATTRSLCCSGVECDLNVNNAVGIRNTHLMNAYANCESNGPHFASTTVRSMPDVNDSNLIWIDSFEENFQVIFLLASFHCWRFTIAGDRCRGCQWPWLLPVTVTSTGDRDLYWWPWPLPVTVTSTGDRDLHRGWLRGDRCLAVEPRVCELALFLKHWGKVQNINDAKTGTISSYSLVLMLIHYLQCEYADTLSAAWVRWYTICSVSMLIHYLQCEYTDTLSVVWVHWYTICNVSTLIHYLQCEYTDTLSAVWVRWYTICSVSTLIHYLQCEYADTLCSVSTLIHYMQCEYADTLSAVKVQTADTLSVI